MIDEKKLIEEFEKRMQDDNKMCPVIKVLDVLEIIEEQPKVGEWIPCSERLPIKEYENGKNIRGEDAVYPALVTAKVVDFEANEELILTHEAWFFEWNGKLDFYFNSEEKANVIAWQPLPQPYKGE